MKNLKSILRFFFILFILSSCETNEVAEEQDLADEDIEILIDEDVENSFDESKIYQLNGDSWLTVGVAKAPARARVILEVYFEDGTIEKSESDPNSYLFTSLRVKQDAIKARLRVIDQDNLSGIEFSVLCKLSDLDREYDYFQIHEQDIRYFSKTVLFREQ